MVRTPLELRQGSGTEQINPYLLPCPVHHIQWARQSADTQFELFFGASGLR
jgi:hypothetical protein